MSAPRTLVTELGTGLGMLGLGTDVLDGDPPPQLRRVDRATWATLVGARDDEQLRGDLARAVANGHAFLVAADALDRRIPRRVEWRGPTRAPGDEVVPIDLRVDHVYLVSCKYLSRIVINASPSHLFDRLLAGGHGRRSGTDWFREMAPAELQALYTTARATCGWSRLPLRVEDLAAADRALLRRSLPSRFEGELAQRYGALCERVAVASADRWRANVAAEGADVVLRRMLRIGSAPYFLLGTAPGGDLRLRIGTSWDWRVRHRTRELRIAARPAGQPCVAWEALVSDVVTGDEVVVGGHVEVRWSHGKFAGPPEAKVYLETPHPLVPCYSELR